MASFGTETTTMFEGGGTGGAASLPVAKVEVIGGAPFKQVSFPGGAIAPDDGAIYLVAPIVLALSPVLWLQSDLGVLLVMG